MEGRTAVRHNESLWVWLLLVATVLLVELPAVVQKCVFDEAQAQVRVLRAAPPQPRSQSRVRVQTGQELLLTSEHQTRWRRLTVKKRSILGKLVPTPSSPPQPIRIKTWTPRGSFTLSETERWRLEAAVEEAVRVVSSLLSVNRAEGPLLLSRDINKYCKFLWKNSSTVNYNRCGRANKSYRAETCLDVTIPDDHLSGCDIYPEADCAHRTVLRPEGAGLPDTDFLLYINVRITDKCRAEPNVLAYAVHCQTDPWGRPVAGVVVLCRDGLTGDTYDHRTTVQTVIHELFHALGFSKDLFSTWRDCSSSYQGGAPCSPRGKVIHSDESGQVRVYTPSIISALQKHLVSTDPELGGPLENLDGSAGRGSSHWESRVLQGSIMTAVLGDPTTVRIDPVTLAALQDTGWYRVNQSRAQSLVWGDSGGASFGSLSTCKHNSSTFFCTGSGVGCHFLHLHKGACQTDPYLEGCRVYKPIQNQSKCWRKETIRQSDEESGEVFGFDSRCFFSSLTRQVNVVQLSSSVEGRCYRHRCTGPNQYQLQVSDSEWVDCPAGGAIQIKGYQGLVFCPDRRLCLYPDVAPPLEDNHQFPACNLCDVPGSFPPAQDGTRSSLGSHSSAGVATSVCVAAAACLMAALLLSYRKCRTYVNRIQTVVPEDHSQL